MGDGPNSIESGFGHQRSNGAGSRAGPATTILRAESAANRRRLKDAEKAMLRQPRGRHRGDDADGNSHQDTGAPDRPPQATADCGRRHPPRGRHHDGYPWGEAGRVDRNRTLGHNPR